MTSSSAPPESPNKQPNKQVKTKVKKKPVSASSTQKSTKAGRSKSSTRKKVTLKTNDTNQSLRDIRKEPGFGSVEGDVDGDFLARLVSRPAPKVNTTVSRTSKGGAIVEPKPVSLASINKAVSSVPVRDLVLYAPMESYLLFPARGKSNTKSSATADDLIEECRVSTPEQVFVEISSSPVLWEPLPSSPPPPSPSASVIHLLSSSPPPFRDAFIISSDRSCSGLSSEDANNKRIHDLDEDFIRATGKSSTETNIQASRTSARNTAEPQTTRSEPYDYSASSSHEDGSDIASYSSPFDNSFEADMDELEASLRSDGMIIEGGSSSPKQNCSQEAPASPNGLFKKKRRRLTHRRVAQSSEEETEPERRQVRRG